MSHNGHMSEAHDFKLALTRVIEPTGGPGAELATLEDAVRFIGSARLLTLRRGLDRVSRPTPRRQMLR
jgi:hypothetical protein